VGSLYYTDAAQLLRAAGLKVVEWAGWQTRARSSGGFSSAPLGVQWHHTASQTTPENDVRWQANNSDVAPIGNGTIMRDGTVYLIAAGAANTAGRGGPLTLSRGTVPLDGANTRTWAWEVANNGVGEPWPEAQINAYFIASNVMNKRFGNKPTDVFTHALGTGNGWTSRKVDPATAAAVQGPWKPRSVTSSGTWSLDDVRAECARRAGTTVPPTTPPPTTPPPTASGKYTVKAGDSWWSISQAYKVSVDFLVKLNPPATSSTVIHPGQVINVPVVTAPPTTPPPTTPPPTGGKDMAAIMPTIKKGSTGPYVERMQHLLAAAGFMDPGNTSNYDGVWGSGTESAKARFDDAHGIGAGNTDCGPKSWESLLTGKVW
jgi:LysM repeat protein